MNVFHATGLIMDAKHDLIFVLFFGGFHQPTDTAELY